ncbi:spore germination protein GerPB [Bacillus sp. FJAT-52991]|uniref:Spore germination protein GerPB n=1 Tax=Bacillus kandeliae TaxID=3129297 RepID=A0ABZ2N892_9BACI
MNIYVSQSINIRFLNIGGISSSSMLQIGTCGKVEQSSYSLNTGGFSGKAPQLTGSTIITEGPKIPLFLIPLQPPS